MTSRMSKEDENMMGRMRVNMERTLGGIKAAGPTDEEQRAQELFYEAMETDNFELILEALEIDPVNVDCLMQMLLLYDMDDEDGLLFAQNIVAVAEARLGEEIFTEGKGYFWGLLETRPYMRARCEVARRFIHLGRIEDAIVEHEEMLELCPDDNLGLRYELISLYLQEQRLVDAAKLLDQYKEERRFSALMAWAYVLDRFLSGNLGEAAEALDSAREVNGYVEVYLKGHRKLPKEEPGFYAPGSREEAQIFAGSLMAAWEAHPGAIEWLFSK